MDQTLLMVAIGLLLLILLSLWIILYQIDQQAWTYVVALDDVERSRPNGGILAPRQIG